jgi:hypothetical protein
VKEYYVYEWIRLDTNEPFYVGQGKNQRAYNWSARNQRFKEVVEEVGRENVAVNILHDNLTQDEAFGLEYKYVTAYKYDFGYELANVTDGGEINAGWKLTEKQKQMKSGKNHPFYGKKTHLHGKSGGDSPTAKGITIYNNGNFYGEFGAISEAAKHFSAINGLSVDTNRNALSKILRGHKYECGRWIGFSVTNQKAIS